MATRLLKFTGKASGEKVGVLPDGRKVQKGHSVEVDPLVALSLLGVRVEDKRDWEPQSRSDG